MIILIAFCISLMKNHNLHNKYHELERKYEMLLYDYNRIHNQLMYLDKPT